MKFLIISIVAVVAVGCGANPIGVGGGDSFASREAPPEEQAPAAPLHPWDGDWRITRTVGSELCVVIDRSRVVNWYWCHSPEDNSGIGLSSTTATLSGNRFLLSWYYWEEFDFDDDAFHSTSFSFTGTPQGDGTFWGTSRINMQSNLNGGRFDESETVSEAAMVRR